MKQNYFYSEKSPLSLKLSKIFRLLLAVFIFIGINTTVIAQSGIYESYAILNSNGAGNIYYDLQASTGNTDFDGANLGTFNSSNTLILNGAQNKTFKCNTDDITNGKFYYRIYKTTDPAPIFIESPIFWTSNDGLTGSNCGGSDQNQTWQSNGANINILNGLCPGIYYLEIYTTADFNYTVSGGGSGTHFASNSGTNYKAFITVVGTDTVAPITPTLADVNVGQCDGTPIAPTTTDACSGTITGTTATIFPITVQGTTVVTWTFNDGNGNSTTANQNVIVDDTVAPITPTLADVNVGQCDGTPTAPTTTDACSGTITGTTATIFPITTQGTTVVTWTFNDGNGNSTTANQNVIVDDTVAPVTPILADANVGQCDGTPTAPTTTDACVGTITGTTATIFPITTQGTTVVTWTFNDGNGNSTTANQNVIVDDTVAPVTPTLADVNVGQCDGTPTAPTTTDACSGTITGTTATIFPITTQGTTVVTWTFNDGNGNSTTANQNVIVDDTVAPVTPILADANVGQCDGTPTAPTTTDACVGTITGTTATIFPITIQGTTVVTWTFNDGNGNSTTANQNVIVDDTVAPVTPTLADANVGQCDGTPTAPTTTDACAGTITGTTLTSFPITTQGTTVVTWTFNDGNGNSTTANQNVIVDDTVAPVTPTLADVNVGQCDGTPTAPTTTDACSGIITGTTATIFPITTQGTTVVTWTFNDGNGNSTTANQNVIVDDTVAPVTPILADVNVGQCSGTPPTPTITDACSGTITGTTSTIFPITIQGTTVVTWTFNDGNGNSTTANQNVIVDDTVAPVTPTLADANVGQCDGTPIAPTTTDACSGIITGTTATIFPITTQGTTVVTWTFNDGNGNSTTANQNVIVDDTVAPVTPILADVNVGQCDGTPTAPTTTDACAGTITGTTATIFPITTQGTTVVIWTFNDGNGNSTTANQNVIVDDTTKPTLTAIANRNENIVTACSFTIPDYTGLTTESDNCTAAGSIIKMQSPVSGTVISGHNMTQLITITADDGNGNIESTTFTITLKDITPPTITCPAAATGNTNNDGAGNCTTIVSLGTPTVSDNCASVGNIIFTAKVSGVTINPLTYSFGIGSTTVVWTATDQNGNVSMPCNQSVTVIDNENPTINCPANVLLASNNGCTATGVVLGTPVANDNCSVASVSNNAPVAFPLGNTTVTWTVTDASGNTATCTQTVTVLDQTLPTAICKNISVNLNALGTASITADDINNNSTDNCGIASLVASKTTFNCANIGANSVTLTVTDTSGNVSSCTATVTVVDAIAPIALCKPFTLNLNASGNATLLATDIDNGSSDNCSFARTISKSSFNCSNIGTNTVLLTITDGSGNSANCNATVTVVDAIAPIAQCKNFTLNLNAAGSATLLATNIDNGSTDNCSIATRTVSPSSFTCANVGNNTVTLTVTDTSGNVSTCTATVTIRDLIAPTAICRPVTINLDSSGIATLTTTAVNNGSFDNCGSVTLSLSKTSFNCTNRGTNTVTLTVTDTAGNSSTCNATVTVVDNTAPVATCKNFTLVLNAATGIGTLLPANIDNGSTDNCGVVSYQISKNNSTFSNSLSYNCSDVGTKTVYLRVTDAAGNSNNCTATVTVQTTLKIDNIFLEVCGARFGSSVSGGDGPYTYNWVDIGGSGQEFFRTYFIIFPTNHPTSNVADPYYNLSLPNGIYTTRLTVTDANGCVVTRDLTFDGGAFNGSTATVNTKACVGETIVYSSSKTSGGGITYQYAWTVTGGSIISGGGANNNTVTVQWNTAGIGKVEVINTPNIFGGACYSIDQNNVTVNSLPTPAFVTPILSTCPQWPQTYTLAANTFSTRVWTVTGGTVTAGGDPADNSVTVKWGNGATGTVSVTVTNPVASGGCSASVSATVNIVDTIPPTIACPANVTVNANTGLCYATGVNIGTPVTADNCGVASVTNNALTQFPTGRYPIGVSTITWTVTDYKGLTATCTQTVTVVDNQFPVIACQANVNLFTAAASCAAFYNPTLPVYSDNCTLPANPLTWTMSGANTASGTGDIPNTAFNRGNTIINYTVTDASLKTISCSFTVAVTDNIPPTITCPGPINTTTNTACTATGVALGTPITADNCSVVSVTNNAPAAYPIGLTTVTWTVTDVAGLTATCSQTVTVTDTTPPTIACPSNITTTTAVGVCTRLVNVPSPTTADNCSVIAKLTWTMTGATTATSALIGINPVGNYTFNLGITTVQYTVTDSANNTANCSFTVTVNDNQPPVFTSCPSNPSPLCADNSATYTKIGTSWNAIATDVCSAISSLTYTLSGSTTGTGTNLNGVAFNVGTTTVTWTATDTAGNVSNCVYTVTIIGLPVITIQPLSQLDCEGASVNFTVVATGTGLTYSWQYKRPVDSSYTTIISNSTNVDNFNENKITIRNIGSAQFPDGTQFQVIISNSSGCSVTSSAATLSVNEITGVSPLASTVTQCSGTDYSYTVTTSYPANVVSYQWKSSVASGSWTDVIDGTHFSGAQSATLNILNGTPAESAEYRVYITFDASGADCNVSSSSRTRQITFLPLLTASVSISESANSICPGTPVTFTATPTNGGTTPTYQWKLNGGNVGTNSAIYINSALVNGDVVTCVMTSSATPCLTGSPATSNAVTMVVIPTLSAVSLAITGSPTVCLSDIATVLSVVETPGATIASRQWGTRAVSGGIITPIGGATASSFTAGTGLTAGTYIVVCTSTSACGVSVVSNELSITVYGPPPAPGPITGNLNQCAGNISQVYSVVAVTGATSYNWYLPVGWTITSGAGTNAITVTVGSNSGTINVNSISACGTGYGPYIYVTVSQPTVAGTLTPANTNTCSSGPNALLTLSGYTGGVIGWESSTDNFVSQISYIVNSNNPFNPFSVNTYTQDTHFRAVVKNGGCNIVYSNSVLVTIAQAMANPGGISVNGTAYPPNGGITHCSNTSTTLSIAPVTNATNYTWIVPSGWTISSGQGTTSIIVTTGGTTTSGNVQVYASNTGCGNTQSSYLYLYLVPSSAPTVALTQPTCAAPTGTITVTLPVPAARITYTVVGTNPVVAAITNSSGLFPGLAPGNYDVTVNNGFYDDIAAPFPKALVPLSNCVTTTSVTINPLVANTWSGTWSTGSPPTIDQNIVFNTGFSSTTDVEGCSCTVNSGAVVFNPGHTLVITNWVHVNGGSLTFDDTASLVQINNVSNTNLGNITYKRQTTVISNMDYTYWSTPVLPFTLGGVSPLTLGDKFYSYDASIDDWKQESAATSMVSGMGYIIRGPQNYQFPNPPSLYEASFIGVPNNGHYEIPSIIADRSYLIGNPYPSALDADTFLNANQNVLDGTLYFWTHNTPIAVGTPNPGTGLYAYSGDDYASYNLTGGVGTQAPSSIPPFTGLNSNIPSGKIASGQGFFGSSKLAPIGTSIVFDNNMRVGVGGIIGDNSQFFKTKNPKGKTAIELEKHRIWLDLTNAQGAFKQTLVGYVTDATNEYEGRFDGQSYNGNDFLDFYSILNNKNLVIQGRALPFDENDEVPLGYRVAVDGTFTVSIDQTDGLLMNQAVYLEDKLANRVFDLKTGNYTFATTAGTFNDRFVLRYTDKALSVDETENDGIVVLYSNNYKTLIIRNSVKDATVNSVTLYNMSGQKIAYWDVKGREQTSIQIPIKNLPAEIYIVKVKTTKGESSKKIIIK